MLLGSYQLHGPAEIMVYYLDYLLELQESEANRTSSSLWSFINVIEENHFHS